MRIVIHTGFTLIEMALTLVVLAVIAGLAAPSFTGMLQRNRAATAANELLTALQLARAEAIRQRRPITACRRNSTGNACENGTDWSAGWLVQNADGVIRVWDPTQGKVAFTGPDTGVVFSAGGLADSSQVFTVESGSTVRSVNVNPTGRAYIVR